MTSFISTLKILTWPIRWFFVTTKTDEIVINSFVDWFGSIPGFKQQVLFMLGWVAIVIIYPLLDPNMLHLMAFLTIYSGITQPMIAIQNSHASMLLIQTLKAQQVQLETLKAMLQHQKEENK